MRTFDVYKHRTQGYEAVKQGFSWPAFFFTRIWAFVKKLWLHGIVGLVVLAFLEAAFDVFQSEGQPGAAGVALRLQLLGI